MSHYSINSRSLAPSGHEEEGRHGMTMDLPEFEAASNQARWTGVPMDGCYQSANGFDVYFFLWGVYLGCARFSGKHSRWRAARSAGFQGLNRLAPSVGLEGYHDDWRQAHSQLLQGPFRIEDFEHVRSVFSADVDYTLNWVFASTSGIHGSYMTIGDLLQNWDELEADPEESHTLTITIFQPRIVRVHYGTVEVTKEDLVWLSDQIQKSILGVIRSQQGNMFAPHAFPRI